MQVKQMLNPGSAIRAGFAAMVVAGATLLSGCASVEQRTFGTPEEAVDAMVASVRPEVDRDGLREVFGAAIEDGLMSGDPVSDREDIAEFLERFDRGHRFVEQPDGSVVLEIGDDGWPFAFPLVRRDGAWKFDTASGIEEVQNRRVGANELDTIQTMLAVVDAQREYAVFDADGDGWRAYAQRFRSDAGTRNGLYWPVGPGEAMSPLGALVADAVERGYDRSDGVYLGYRYRMLTGQGPGAPGGAFDFVVDDRMVGGFGVVAWPAEYGESGVMTFITSHDGVVYEKDLGRRTDRAARSMRVFDPAGWSQVSSEVQTAGD